ncbi:conserved membrane protein of unknown function (plasmid) [Streptantibioticus cattleyicolor NRRL 8057 = DSM 46488]|nr:conserved membrane protein of unknown function [Streptantibioticus cattleyicolor NRRL 8057 = DSM 46488]
MSTPPPLPRRAAVAAAPAAFMLVSGLWGIGRHHSLWRDEAATWQVAHRTVAQIWYMSGQVDLVHTLYYVVMHQVFAVLGDSLLALRLPSVLGATVAAALTARIGARTGGPLTGVAAGLFFVLLPSAQHYAQEGRSYALVLAGAATATWLLVRALDRPRGRAHWVCYGVAVLVTALLNWFSLLLLLGHAPTVWRAAAGRGARTGWAVSSAAALAGALPLVLASRGQADQVSWIRPPGWGTLLTVGAPLVCGAVCARLARRGPGRVALPVVALPLLAAPSLALLAASAVKPLYVDRYVLFTRVGLALLLGAAASATVRAAAARRYERPWLLVPMTAAAVVLALLPVARRERTPAARVDDVLAAAATVARVSRPGDGVVFVPAARRDTKLVSPRDFAGLDDLALERGPVASGTLKGEEAPPDRVRAAMLARPRIVLVTDARSVTRPALSPVDRVKLAVLRGDFTRGADTEVNGRRVTLYVRRDGLNGIPDATSVVRHRLAVPPVGPVDLGHVLLGPGADGGQRGVEGEAERGEPVEDGGRDGGLDPAVDQAVPGQGAQGHREHLLRHPRHPAPQLGEAQFARGRLGQHLDRHRRPLGADPVQQPAGRAVRVEEVTARAAGDTSVPGGHLELTTCRESAFLAPRP